MLMYGYAFLVQMQEIGIYVLLHCLKESGSAKL